MKKMLISVLLAMIIMWTASVAVFAHPESFVEGSQSAVTNLITIRKPDSASTSTVKTTYSVTGSGKEGVSICFYTYDGEKYVPQKDASGNLVSYTIGASGVFYRQISLKEGENKICVRAEAADGTYQLSYLTINVIKSGVLTDVKTFSFNLQSKLNGWLN